MKHTDPEPAPLGALDILASVAFIIIILLGIIGVVCMATGVIPADDLQPSETTTSSINRSTP